MEVGKFVFDERAAVLVPDEFLPFPEHLEAGRHAKEHEDEALGQHEPVVAEDRRLTRKVNSSR